MLNKYRLDRNQAVDVRVPVLNERFGSVDASVRKMRYSEYQAIIGMDIIRKL
jgi:hypothetical protein